MTDPGLTLGELVAEQPARAAVLEQLRLDYCCHGQRTLEEACASGGIELDAVCAMLEGLDPAGGAHIACGATDWRHASLSGLCEHIVAVHHDGLRQTLPRIAELLATVVRVHGPAHPDLHELRAEFGRLRTELEPHLESEETTLFPACTALERTGAGADDAMLSEHEREHETVGARLGAMRSLGSDYDAERALCATHRELLCALAELERDLHQRIHEENNILIPRARSLNASAVQAELPRCCQAWVAEQTRAWSR